ncbi:hypothetical protein AVEN_56032-1 [Araneus ventricosus]|uniref:Pre-C2HC domain-containing protein n=1 Tax=Araneus ventricosus TaxID=182803 RepID=A0A4Y2DLS7_ARAVE|nr:hypothetical protein AVEN_56032-1 [Araneus ventricosus]
MFLLQKFNRHSSGCKLTIKCVLCSKEYDSRTCPNKKNSEFTPKCANCGDLHTASYRGCPNFPKIKNKIIERKTFAYVLKEKKKPVEVNSEIPPPSVHHVDTPKRPNMELSSNQEAVRNFSIPQDLISNQEELVDRFLKQMKIILSKILDVKKTLEKNGNN